MKLKNQFLRKLLRITKLYIIDIRTELSLYRWLGGKKYIDYYKFDVAIFNENKKPKSPKVLIYNKNLPALGGGEKHMALFCKYFELYNSEAIIHILVEDSRSICVFDPKYPTIQDINKQFNIDLSKTSIIKRKAINQDFLTKFSFNYDIFINSTIDSRLIGFAKRNFYNCMFPPKKEDNDDLLNQLFKKSYLCFISNSDFTNQWLHRYWGYEIQSQCIYPPVFTEHEIFSRIKKPKKNIILSVGRFFFGAHSKRQDIMIDFWNNNHNEFIGWELHLVGNRQINKEDKKYIEDIILKASKGCNIFLHFDMPIGDLHKLYESAKIYWHATGFGVDVDVNPEKMEHFGITTVEAMSYGIIPIVINKGGQCEIVDHGINGYKWDTLNEWIEYNRIVIDNYELQQKISNEAINKSYNYSVENFYTNCDRIFSEKIL
ncbi:glycosyltransferase [Treponema zuelzerae]|uniref:Glycosyltransferase n=1 Tax=Teretinema zuelzerae TaxID=156 RepID=A0AAE3EHD0_9SPIR|nr:glycosyltransferase [Teretinema zuelzerae]MCD1654647.1 glycosyltransferase [Teretinema zuelzerae]